MGTYGRNFDFRIVPTENDRKGRYVVIDRAGIVIGAPILAGSPPIDQVTDSLPVQLAIGEQPWKSGFTGICVYEHIDLWGYDTALWGYSDLDIAPYERSCQLVGTEAKVVFRNTTARTFAGTRSYTGRIMVAGMGATPTVTVGDYLTPGVGNDTDGYWAVTQTPANGWLVVTNVDALRQEVEAVFNF
jgi:hypothetical protein